MRTEQMKNLDADFNEYSGATTGFETRISSDPTKLTHEELDGCRKRYETIKLFQQNVIKIFRASLLGEIDPSIAKGILGDINSCYGADYHLQLPDSAWTTPVFFRTDEAILGQLTEIQCSGSGWDLVQALYEHYQRHPEQFGKPKYFTKSLAENYVAALKVHIGTTPIIHHLADNASRPHGARYFLQKARKYGAQYYSYDTAATAKSCNFIRSHDFFSIVIHNFFHDRLQRSQKGEVIFDLPPIALFDSKLIMSWPFWSKTRDYFSDAERSLFPFTTMVEKDGMEWEDGSKISIEQFINIPNNQRKYFIKYAGTDVAVNWGSKAVFSAQSMSKSRIAPHIKKVVQEVNTGRPWVVQKAVLNKTMVKALCPETGQSESLASYPKWCSFYGPTGHLGLLAMYRNAHKVHGSKDTILSIGY